MTITIRATFCPLRLRISRKEPVQMRVIVRNLDENEKKLTVRVMLPNKLAFDKGGLRNAELETIDSIAGKGEKMFYYDIFPKGNTTPGEYSIIIKTQEHQGNYEYAKNQYDHEELIQVED